MWITLFIALKQIFVSEWSSVFDRRINSVQNVGKSFNPWQSAPASDTTEQNSWADFGASSSYSGETGDPFSQGDSQTQSGTNFAPFPPTNTCAVSSHPSPSFQTDFSNILFTNVKHETHQVLEGCFSTCVSLGTSSPHTYSQSEEGPRDDAKHLHSESESFQDVCDATQTIKHMQQK